MKPLTRKLSNVTLYYIARDIVKNYRTNSKINSEYFQRNEYCMKMHNLYLTLRAVPLYKTNKFLVFTRDRQDELGHP